MKKIDVIGYFALLGIWAALITCAFWCTGISPLIVIATFGAVLSTGLVNMTVFLRDISIIATAVRNYGRK